MLSALLLPPSQGDDVGHVRVKTVDGKVHQGSIHVWRADGELVIVSNQGRSDGIDAHRVDRVEFSCRQDKPSFGDWRIETKDGDRLLGDIVRGGEDKVTVRHHQLGEISLPLDGLDAIGKWGKSTAGGLDRSVDSVLLMNGDVNRGVITAVGRDGVSIFSNDTEQVRSWSVIQAIQFASSPVSGKNAVSIRLRFLDGSKVMAKTLERENKTVRIVLATGQSVHCHVGFIADAEMMGGSRVWLTDLRPVMHESMPFFVRQWPMGINTNAFGGPLRIAGKDYARGLGLHSACRLQWQLDGQFERFTGLVGIDDSSGRWADAELVLRVDDRSVAHLSGLQHGQQPRKVDVSLKGKRKLVIEVGFGRFGDTQDRVNLVDPALIRRPAASERPAKAR